MYSDNSTFADCDTVRHRYFEVYTEDGKYKAACEILSPGMHDAGPQSFWKIILYSKDDSLMSNAFQISTGYPLLRMKIGDKSLMITEEPKDVYNGLSAIGILLLTKAFLFILFFVRRDYTLRAFRNTIGLFLLSPLACLLGFLLSALLYTGWPILFTPLLFIYVECLIIKKYILPQREMQYIALATTVGSLISLFAFFFTAFLISFGE